MFKEDKRLRFLLNQEDYDAIEEKDHEYLNSKGAEYYNHGAYESARTYYEISAMLGNRDAITNLGYMYLYGKGAPIDYTAALAFYQMGAKKGSIDAHYKLGNIYQSGKGVPQDNNKALTYYDAALTLLEKENKADPADYPSLFFTLGREMLPEGIIEENLPRAYDYLLIAEEGYEKQIKIYGSKYYRNIIEETRRLLRSEIFDNLRSRKVPSPIYTLFEKKYKVKGTQLTGTLIKSTYSYEDNEIIYILEDKNHEYHDARESELAELL